MKLKGMLFFFCHYYWFWHEIFCLFAWSSPALLQRCVLLPFICLPLGLALVFCAIKQYRIPNGNLCISLNCCFLITLFSVHCFLTVLWLQGWNLHSEFRGGPTAHAERREVKSKTYILYLYVASGAFFINSSHYRGFGVISQLICHFYYNYVLSWLTLCFWSRTSKIWIWKFVKNKVYQIKDRCEPMGVFFR